MEQKKHYWFRRWIAIALSMMLCAGTLSVNALAADAQSATVETESTTEAAQETIDETEQEESTDTEVAEKETAEDTEEETAAEDTAEEGSQKDTALEEEDESTDENTLEQDEEGEASSENDSSEEAVPVEEQNGQDAEQVEDDNTSEQAAEDVSAPEKETQNEAQNSSISDPLRMDVSYFTMESGEACNFHNYSNHEFVRSASSSNPDVVAIDKIDDYNVSIKAGFAGDAVISVTGTRGTVFNIKVSVSFNGEPLAFDDTDLTLTAGESYYVFRSTFDEEIKSISISNPKSVGVDDNGFLDVMALYPGKAVVTITGTAGTKCTLNVTVKSFLTASSINVYAGGRKYVDFVDHYSFGRTVATSNYRIATSGIYEMENYEDKLLICGQSAGKAVITVKGDNNSYCTVDVNVINPPFNLSTSSLTIDRVKSYTVTADGSDISTAVSSNTGIFTVKKTSARCVQITPVKAGTAKLTLKSKYGVTKSVNITITSRYFLSCVVNLSKPLDQAYASGYINGTGAPYSKASVTIGGKTYSTTVNAKGNFVIRNIPYVKIGTVLRVTFTLQGQSSTKTIKILTGSHSVYTPNYTYKDTKTVSVQAKNVHSGDKIKITVNGKNYYRTFKQSYKTITVKVNIDKPGQYGIKMITRLLNKFDQQLARENEYVYHSDTVHVGDSKAKVRWLTGWNDPEYINYYSTGEQWCYDWKYDDGITDAYLYFNTSGKVTNWWVED